MGIDYTLRTDRLVLRLMTLQDAKSIFDAYASDPEAARFMTFTTQTDVSETLDYLMSQRSAFEQGTSILWAITLKNDDAFAGAIEIRIDGDEGEIGFIIGRPYWGRGIVPEALRAVLTFASDTLKLSEVRGRCDIDNTRSARVFEKTGFRSLGIVEKSVLHPNISKAPRDGRAFVYDVRRLRTSGDGGAAVSLRPATPSDRAFVESVYFETQRWIIEALFGWRGDEIERAKFEEVYSESESQIVSLDGQDVGWMSVRRQDHGAMDLDALYLLPVAQKKGIGTILVRNVIGGAIVAGVPLTVSTAKINPARHLYARLGFVATHESDFKVFMEYRPALENHVVDDNALRT